MPLLSWTWTSAINFGRDGDFFWDSTGAFIGPHINWAANEPNNYNNTENCMSLVIEAAIYKWADTPCYYINTYICEA
jgi:Lectin C-type domain